MIRERIDFEYSCRSLIDSRFCRSCITDIPTPAEAILAQISVQSDRDHVASESDSTASDIVHSPVPASTEPFQTQLFWLPYQVRAIGKVNLVQQLLTERRNATGTNGDTPARIEWCFLRVFSYERPREPITWIERRLRELSASIEESDTAFTDLDHPFLDYLNAHFLLLVGYERSI